MDRLFIVKFHTNIANRWLFMIQVKIMVILLYSESYFDMFRGAVFIRTRCISQTNVPSIQSPVCTLLFIHGTV